MFQTMCFAIDDDANNNALTLDKQLDWIEKIIAALENGDLQTILAQVLLDRLIIDANYRGVRE